MILLTQLLVYSGAHYRGQLVGAALAIVLTLVLFVGLLMRRRVLRRVGTAQ